MKFRVLVAVVVAVLAGLGDGRTGPQLVRESVAQGLPIQHVIIIMQENRSFASYFGTFPGADWIPMQNGVPDRLHPRPGVQSVRPPYHDPNDRNLGGPHGETQAKMDIDGGKMDGFIAEEHAGRQRACATSQDPSCSQGGQTDVMGYHDQREIPNLLDLPPTVRAAGPHV